MFPLIPASISLDLAHEHLQSPARERVLPSRLDIQRRHLEHKHMFNLDTMTVDMTHDRMERELAFRQRIALAKGDRLTVMARVRHALARFLVSAGERIHPEIEPVREPRLNA